MILHALFLVACTQGSLPESVPNVSVTVTAPDGDDWITSDAEILIKHMTGANCLSADWFRVTEGSPAVYLWFAQTDADSVVMGDDVLVALWNVESDLPDRRYLFGGLGSMVERDSTHIEYKVEAGQDCVYDSNADDYVCIDQAAPMIFLVEGENLDEIPTLDMSGSSGWATEPTTSDDVCGAEAPGI
jgi:hypothetical protein